MQACHCTDTTEGAKWLPDEVDYLDQAQCNALHMMRHLAIDKGAAHHMAAHAAVPHP